MKKTMTPGPMQSGPGDQGEGSVPSDRATMIEVPRNNSYAVHPGRNALRRRYIRHKQMSSMNPKALNEVSPGSGYYRLAIHSLTPS